MIQEVRLERPRRAHEAEFLRAVRRSRALHRGWVSPPRNADKFRDYLKGLRKPSREVFLVLSPSDELAGVVNVSEIARGNFHSAYLGYYAFAPWAGMGCMRRGLELVIGHCFGKLRLHRLEANIRPENERSIALVGGLGFRLEGFSPRYLKVCGSWRDHERWAILADQWRALRRGSGREEDYAGFAL